MARYLAREGHQSWTAYQANLHQALDEELVYYAAEKGAILVTINKDCARIARRIRATQAIYLVVVEQNAVEATERALQWLASNQIPAGQVLRVPRRADLKVMAPLWDLL